MNNGKAVELIKLTKEEKKLYNDLELQIFEITNNLMKSQLSGFELTLDNGWKISFKNKKFAENIGVPM